MGGGVLGVPWEFTSDTIQFQFGLNMSQKVQGVRSDPELTDHSLHIIDETVITKRLVISAMKLIYDPLCLVSPLTVKYKILM